MATHQKKHIKNTGGSKELVFKSNDNEEYGEILNAKGDARFEVKLISNGFTVIAKIRGALIKGPNKQKVDKGSVVLLQKDMATYDEKYYIIHKYTKDNVKSLKKLGELATYILVEEDDNNNVVFEDDVENKTLDEIDIDDNFIAGI
jgi:initiation factor 1A